MEEEAVVDFGDLLQYPSSASTVASGSAISDYTRIEVFRCSVNYLTYSDISSVILEQNTNVLKDLFLSCQCCITAKIPYCVHAENLLKAALNEFKQTFSNYRIVRGKFEVSSSLLPEGLRHVFTVVPVEPDGNCFFAAISACVFNTTCYGKILRRCCHLEIKLNKLLSERIKYISQLDYEEQDKILSTDSSWAKSVTIFIASVVIQQPIVVYQPNPDGGFSGVRYVSDEYKDNPTIYLWLDSNHFEALILKSTNIEAPPVDYIPPEFRNVKKRSNAKSMKKFASVLPQHPNEDQQDIGENATYDKIPTTSEVMNTEILMENTIDYKSFIERPKILYKNSNKILYCKTLLEFESKLRSLKHTNVITDVLKTYVESTVPWSNYLNPILKARKVSNNEIKKIVKCVYFIQKSEWGKNAFTSMLNNTQADEKTATYYVKISDKKFNRIQNATLNIENPNPSADENKNCDDDATICDEQAFILTDEECDINSSEKHEINESTHEEKQEDGSDFKSSPEKKTAFCAPKSLLQMFNLKKSDLEYIPPKLFKIKIPADAMKDIFDFDKMKFRQRSWPLAINRAFQVANVVCSFSAKKTPTYCSKKLKHFCKMVGKCSGDCEMNFTIVAAKKPIPGKKLRCTVFTNGAFNLLQDRPTGRQIRGSDREEMKQKLLLRHPKSVFLTNIRHIEGLRALHRNYQQKSESSLRKIKSDIKKDARLDNDPQKEIILLREQYRQTVNTNKKITGYIQHSNSVPENFQLLLYTYNSLKFHADQNKIGITTCFFDATGGIMKKISYKTPLLYVLIGRNKFNITYPIAEFLLEEGTSVEISSYLGRIIRDYIVIKSGTKLFCNCIVIDWSWSMLHAVCKALNDQSVNDYLDNCWELFNGKRWKKSHCCIFICTSHLIAASKRLFSKHLSKSKKDKLILDIALDAVARVQETFNLAELSEILRVIVRLFGREYLYESDIDNCLQIIRRKKPEIEVMIKTEIDADTDTSIMEDDVTCPKSIRDSSRFFSFFENIKFKEINKGDLYGMKKNPYYQPELLNLFGKYKMPMYPFWAAAVPREIFFPSFLRETNASVESSFNLRKNIYDHNKNQRYTDYVKTSYEYHNGSLREAADKLIQVEATRIKSKKSAKEKRSTELEEETWRRRSNNRKSRHFSGNLSRFSKHKTESCIPRELQSDELKRRLPEFGLPNIGHTCYMNASFQLIMNLKEVRLYHESQSLNYPFDAIINGMLFKPINDKEMEELKKEIDVLTENKYKTGVQHDSHEFFSHILSTSDFAFVKSLFKIDVKKIIECAKCKSVREVFQNDYEIMIPVNKTFEESLQNTVLEKNCKLKCDACGQKKCSIYYEYETSKYVLVMISPYGQDEQSVGELMYSRKTKVKPEFLQPQQIIHMPCERQYELLSFTTHEGNFINSGHYRAYFNCGRSFLCVDDDITYNTNSVKGQPYFLIYTLVE